jgi:hypothetical protein
MFSPTADGRAALAELDRVPWGELHHAYGRGVTGAGTTHDVRAALARLGDADDEAVPSGVYALACNAYHQGTIYEVTAHAVPFIAAVACDAALWVGDVRNLVGLLGEIALSSSFETDDGTMAGSFGDDVAESTRVSLRACAARLTRVGGVHEAFARVTTAIAALVEADPPTRARMDALANALRQLEVLELGDRPRRSLPERWVTHAKFGRGRVVERIDAKSRVRFDDGTERTLLDRVLVDCPRPDA